MKIQVTKPFSFAEGGTVVRFLDTGTHEVSARCAEVAIAEGWAKPLKGVKKAPRKKRK